MQMAILRYHSLLFLLGARFHAATELRMLISKWDDLILVSQSKKETLVHVHEHLFDAHLGLYVLCLCWLNDA